MLALRPDQVYGDVKRGFNKKGSLCYFGVLKNIKIKLNSLRGDGPKYIINYFVEIIQIVWINYLKPLGNRVLSTLVLANSEAIQNQRMHKQICR